MGLHDAIFGYQRYQVHRSYRKEPTNHHQYGYAHARYVSITIGFKVSPPLISYCLLGTGWFDIYDLDEDSPEDADGFADSSKRINAFIQAEIDKGIAPNRIVLAGFSQGGAVALHVSLRSEHALGGCIALSTWLPFRSQYPDVLSSAATNLPVLQVHGDEDQVVSYPWGKGSHDVMKGFLTSPAPEFITIEVCHRQTNESLFLDLAHLFLRTQTGNGS